MRVQLDWNVSVINENRDVSQEPSVGCLFICTKNVHKSVPVSSGEMTLDS